MCRNGWKAYVVAVLFQLRIHVTIVVLILEVSAIYRKNRTIMIILLLLLLFLLVAQIVSCSVSDWSRIVNVFPPVGNCIEYMLSRPPRRMA
jgi:hypothetical protein